MKRLLLSVLLILSLTAISYSADKSKAKISFPETLYDFGNIREDGGPVTHEFTFTNEGK